MPRELNIALTLAFTAQAFAGVNIGLAWQASPSQGVTHYRVYASEGTSTNWTMIRQVPADVLSITLTNVNVGDHKFYATACAENVYGQHATVTDESGPSEIATLKVLPRFEPPGAPVLEAIKGRPKPTVATLERNTSLDWPDGWQAFAVWDIDNPQAAYRLVLK